MTCSPRRSTTHGASAARRRRDRRSDAAGKPQRAAGSPRCASRPRSSMDRMTEADTPRIVVAGGGVAGLEACLALRSFLGEDELSHRPALPRRPLRVPPAGRARAVRRRAGVEHEARALRRRPGRAARWRRPGRGRRPTGTSPSRRTPAASPTTRCWSASAPGPSAPLPGAITFRGGRDAAAVRAALDAVQPARRPRSPSPCRSAPSGRCRSTSWRSSPPRDCGPRDAGAGRDHLARGRAAEAFGAAASTAVAQLLDAHGIEFTVTRVRSRPTPASSSSTTAGGSARRRS